jgi:rfaE bifunctional protein nucleotidyltransferase chain/domain
MLFESNITKGHVYDMNIWVNGCFDIIHRGHIELFKFAKSLGTNLIVGTDTDRKIRELKGPSRPINIQEDRITILKAIKYIDLVVLFDTDYEISQHVKQYGIDIIVTSTDHNNHYVPGSEYSRQGVVFFDRIDRISTTQIINKCVIK